MENYVLLVLALTLDICLVAYVLLRYLNIKFLTNHFSVKHITGAAILGTLEIVMIVVSNYITIGPVNMNLALVPIAVGAMLYGPFVGAFLGLVNGLITVLSPSTIAVFMPINALGTVIVCLLKTSIAGFVSGLLFNIFKKKPFVGAFLSSIIVPIINTGLFVVGSYLFFTPWLEDSTSVLGYDNTFLFLLFAVMGWNFLIEIAISVVLSPSVYCVIKIASKNIRKDY